MAVYVDSIHIFEASQIKPGARRYGQTWCHMAADSPEELQQMARSIGLLPAWLQHPGKPLEHYDLTPAKRVEAIRAGAIALEAKEWREFLLLKVKLYHEA